CVWLSWSWHPQTRVRPRHVAPAVCHGFERQTRFGVEGIAASKGLPTPDRDVDITGVNLQGPGMPTDAFGSEQRGAGARKCVEDDGVALRAVLDGISNQRDRFNSRMSPQVVHPPGAKRVGTSVFPHVGARAAVTTKLDGVEVGRLPNPEHADQLVLTAVEEIGRAS